METRGDREHVDSIYAPRFDPWAGELCWRRQAAFCQPAGYCI